MSTDHATPDTSSPDTSSPDTSSSDTSSPDTSPAVTTGRGRGAGFVSLLALTLVLGGVAAASTLVPDARPRSPQVQPLPLTLGSPELACPGPETLAVPEGGRAVAAPGPIWVTGLTGSSHGLAIAGLQAFGKGSPAAITAAGKTKTADRVRITAKDVPAATQAIALNKLGPVILAGQREPSAPTSKNQSSQSAQASQSSADPAPQLAGMQSTLARFGDLRGLAAVSCAVPSASSWLVGGATKAGERLRLLLSNPLPTPAVVDIEVHGPQGSVPAPSGDGVVVPGRGSAVRYIDALTPNLPSVAVHVTARSGRVVATMHDSVLRGLNPGGTEDVSASASPSEFQVIPGVSLVDGYGTTAGDPAAAGSTSVRVAVPGTEEAVVRVRLIDAAGTVNLPRGAVVNVPAGGVVDVPISGVPAKTYTAVVESDVPMVASARVGRSDPAASPAAAEFGWSASSTSINGLGYVVLPRGADSTLSLAAAQTASSVRVREVTASGQLGPIQDVAMKAGTSIAVRITPAAVAVRIEQGKGGAVTAALVATAADPRGALITVPQIHIDTATAPRSSAVADHQLGLP